MYRTSKIPFAFVVLSAGLTASAAHATESLTMTVGGTVVERCSIGAVGGIDHAVALDRAGSKAVDFAVDCNVPIEVSLQAARGSFSLDADRTPDHTADYTGSVNYTAGFTLEIGGRPWEVSGQSGASLRAGKPFVPGGSQRSVPPFAATLRLTTRWNDPVAGLLAGTYRETITVTVTGADPAPPGFAAGS